MTAILPIKELKITPTEIPLGCILRWDFYREQEIVDFLFSDTDYETDFYGLFGENQPGDIDHAYPVNSRIYLFRRIGGLIIADDVEDYFFGLPGNLEPDIWEMRPDTDGIIQRKRLDKERIFHGSQVYYALVIRDMDTGTISEMVTNNIVIN